MENGSMIRKIIIIIVLCAFLCRMFVNQTEWYGMAQNLP